MTQEEFLTELSAVFNKYEWTYVNNTLQAVVRRGKDKGLTCNPITAVARSTGVGTYPSTKRGTLRAAKALGITQELALAVLSRSNRGHAQIVRGKMLTALASV
jgi:hypothetical protein